MVWTAENSPRMSARKTESGGRWGVEGKQTKPCIKQHGVRSMQPSPGGACVSYASSSILQRPSSPPVLPSPPSLAPLRRASSSRPQSPRHWLNRLILLIHVFRGLRPRASVAVRRPASRSALQSPCISTPTTGAPRHQHDRWRRDDEHQREGGKERL
ncbi:hypothetical protein OH77DRAFT_276354 [Trametes cingulata]|nr:hypothetical protein OH77DRAFT_276354 [Trametes cingulata]